MVNEKASSQERKEELLQRFDQALSALDEPVCEACRDTKEVWDTQEFGGREVGDKIPCPDCQQPPASEFVKSVKEYVRIHNFELTADYPNVVQFLKQACTRLTAQQQRIKKMYAGDLSPESRLNGYKVVTAKLQERIEELKGEKVIIQPKRDEAIRFLNSSPPTYGIVYRERQKKLKRILGDEEFEKITKEKN